MQREKLGSRLGFILLSAGCAIGIGNVWKFPSVTGQNGGAIFVLIYLFFLAILGIPVMTMEFSLGRASQKSPAALYQALEPRGTKWHLHGYAALAGNTILMMFYTTVAGWMVQYFVLTARGVFDGLDTSGIADVYNNMLSSPWVLMGYTALVIIIGFAVCSFGVQKGLERITKWMMVALLGLMVVLAVRSLFLPGGKEGLSFNLKPNIGNFVKAGPVKVVVAAMNQAFFTLSLGIGSMAIFGSYIGRDRALMGEAVNVAVLDTFVAICSGLIIFPACSAYSVAVDSGPDLIFKTLPNVFNNMPLGRLWGSLFFVFMSFAALSTVFAVFENIIACTMDVTGWGRKKTCVICLALILVLSLPCVLGFNVFSDFHPFGGTSTIMDIEDFAVNNVLLPLGSLCFVLFSVSKRGWGWDSFVSEANTGKGLKVKRWMRGYVTYVLPCIILVLFVLGVYNFFK